MQQLSKQVISSIKKAISYPIWHVDSIPLVVEQLEHRLNAGDAQMIEEMGRELRVHALHLPRSTVSRRELVEKCENWKPKK